MVEQTRRAAARHAPTPPVWPITCSPVAHAAERTASARDCTRCHDIARPRPLGPRHRPGPARDARPEPPDVEGLLPAAGGPADDTLLDPGRTGSRRASRGRARRRRRRWCSPARPRPGLAAEHRRLRSVRCRGSYAVPAARPARERRRRARHATRASLVRGNRREIGLEADEAAGDVDRGPLRRASTTSTRRRNRRGGPTARPCGRGSGPWRRRRPGTLPDVARARLLGRRWRRLPA